MGHAHRLRSKTVLVRRRGSAKPNLTTEQSSGFRHRLWCKLRRFIRRRALLVWMRTKPVGPSFFERQTARLAAPAEHMRHVPQVSVSKEKTGARGNGLAHILGIGLVLVVVGLMVLGLFQANLETRQSETVSIGGPFSLIGPHGETITEKSFPGRMLLVFFGYTFCPDVCPTTLTKIADALSAMGPDAASVQPLFITVDPARDTPKVLSDYTAHFDERIMGLSGSASAISSAEKAYRVYAAAQPSADGGPTLFDHSAVIYLMSPSGTYLRPFSPDATGAEIAAGIRSYLPQSSAKGEPQ